MFVKKFLDKFIIVEYTAFVEHGSSKKMALWEVPENAPWTRRINPATGSTLSWLSC